MSHTPLSIRTPTPNESESGSDASPYSYVLSSDDESYSPSDSLSASSAESGAESDDPKPVRTLSDHDILVRRFARSLTHPVVVYPCIGTLALFPLLTYVTLATNQVILLGSYTIGLQLYGVLLFVYWTYEPCWWIYDKTFRLATTLVQLDTILTTAETAWLLLLRVNPIITVVSIIVKLYLLGIHRYSTEFCGNIGILGWHLANSLRRAFIVGVIMGAYL